MASALRSGRRGRPFESDHPDQTKKTAGKFQLSFFVLRCVKLFGIRVDAPVPEAGGDVGQTVVRLGRSVVSNLVKTLVGSGRIEGAEMLKIGPDLNIVKGHIKSPLDITAS